MARKSLTNKLEKVRSPRVHISYDVEIGDAIQTRELPFVVAILADLSGQARHSRVRLADRRLLEIDRDNFDDVLAGIAPLVVLDDGTELTFGALADLEPNAVPSAVLGSGRFRQLEATWRGLYYLATETETSNVLKLRVLDVSREELANDLRRAVEVDQSELFKKLYEAEYARFGGDPVALIVGDFEFGANALDVEILERMSNIAAIANAPFVAGASPSLLGLDRFAELGAPRQLANSFDAIEFTKWRSFRETEDSRYVGLTLPHILLRRPHTDRDEPLWGNAAYALAACVTNAFAKYSWCAAIRGVEGGGLVEGLPAMAAPIMGENAAPEKAITDVMIADRREKELSDLGLIPLVAVTGRDYATFFSMTSCCKPKIYHLEAATANSRLWTQLQYVLTAARFAHYLRCIVRDKVGSFMSRRSCQDFLNGWLSRYVLIDADGSTVLKAQFPLAEAHADVEEVPNRPGAYRAVVYLRPHFQLDELSVSLRLVIDLPTVAH
jgi:type VI secretion system protein ImpC